MKPAGASGYKSWEEVCTGLAAPGLGVGMYVSVCAHICAIDVAFWVNKPMRDLEDKGSLTSRGLVTADFPGTVCLLYYYLYLCSMIYLVNFNYLVPFFLVNYFMIEP